MKYLTILFALLLSACSGAQSEPRAPSHETPDKQTAADDRNGSSPTANDKPCVVSGCSGQFCSDEEMMSTCEFRPEYACYREATCERQVDGTCGWTPTPALEHCLTENGNTVYQPCGGKACGEPCTVCRPGDPACTELAGPKWCDATGRCEPAQPEC